MTTEIQDEPQQITDSKTALTQISTGLGPVTPHQACGSNADMETEILKLILKSHGSMNTDELLYNLCEPSFLAELVNQKETFASCVFNGQPKVVVRSRLKLCGTVDCPGCGRLHLCLRFLLCGRCPFTQRGGCHFSHDLQSEYNMKLLSESGLQTLSRSELSLLLLQSHNMLLPQMCHQYNNSGSCQDDCKSLHMCKQYLHQDCSCPKNHDFCAPQPLKLLQEKHIPEHLFHRLKSVYANKEALRLADKANRSRDNNADGDRSADSSSIGAKQSRSRGSRGRGRGRGSKGQRGRQTASGSDGVTSKSEESGRGKIGSNPGNRGGRPGRSDLTGEDDMEEPSVGEALVCGVETESTGDNAQDETVASGAKSSSTADPSDHPSVKNVEAKSSGPPTRQRDKTEICMFFIKGHCIHEDRCFKSHDKMPYRWEIKQDGQWTHMAENESIERDYCVPDNTYR
uniref:C3H1-type domain-containing protein n=1 Tax=Knipowitschia caucasica TaxID=637954 RepID=A0AAV2IY13_KNICA